MITEKSLKLKDRKHSKKRIVVISDTHITPSGDAFNQKAFNLGVSRINAIKGVSMYLHLGDITLSGNLL